MKNDRIMKGFLKRTVFFSAVCAGLLWHTPQPGTAAPLSPTDFKYCSDISGPFNNGSLYRIYLPAEILDHCSQGCADARILGSGNSEIPWVVLEEKFPKENPGTYPLAIIGYQSDSSSSVITMKLPEKYRPVSSLELEIPDQDFKKQASLSGSSDAVIWRRLAEDDIYDFSSQVDLRKTKIEFKPAAYRYYRLALIDNRQQEKNQNSLSLKYQGFDFTVQGGKKDIRIHSVEARTPASEERPVLYDEKSLNKYSASTDRDGNTVIIFTTDLPVDRLTLDIGNPYYYRTIMLYAGDEGKEETHRLIGSQAIYRFPLSGERRETKNSLELHGKKQRFYKLIIENKNSPPLEVKGITAAWIRKNLYFIALSSSERYSLCFGNKTLTAPAYDLARFVTSSTVKQQSFEPRITGPVRENAGYNDKTPGEKKAVTEKSILTSVVALLVLVMGFWLFSLMKKIGSNK